MPESTVPVLDLAFLLAFHSIHFSGASTTPKMQPEARTDRTIRIITGSS